MSEDQQRHQDLTDIRAIAERSFGFIQKVVAPLIVIGITALIGGCFQVRDMSRDFKQMQAVQGDLNTKLELMNEKVLRMFYSGGWDKTDRAERVERDRVAKEKQLQ